MRTARVIAGREEAGAIVCMPSPGMANSIVFVPPPVAVLASRMAWRSEPGPLSAVVVTRKLERTVRSSSQSKRSPCRRRPPRAGHGREALRRWLVRRATGGVGFASLIGAAPLRLDVHPPTLITVASMADLLDCTPAAAEPQRL